METIFWIVYIGVIGFMSGFFIGKYREFRWAKAIIDGLLVVINCQTKIIRAILNQEAEEKLEKLFKDAIDAIEKLQP